MNTLPLHEHHQALGATFQPNGDWETPTHYGNPQSEYEALHTSAGLADLSLRGRVIVTGEDRITWLQSIVSQDILPLQPGQGRYSTFMDHKGKMLSYFRVFIRPDERDTIWREWILRETQFRSCDGPSMAHRLSAHQRGW